MDKKKTPTTGNMNTLGDNYEVLIGDLKRRVNATRYKVALRVNSELITLYHYIGEQILKAQKLNGWGARVIQELSKDLRSAFPNIKGFGLQNLKYMRKFAEEYNNTEISQQAVDQLPWGHIVILIYSLKDKEERNFYTQKTLEFAWSRSILVHQVELDLYKRQHKKDKISNFKGTLPKYQSSLVEQTLKDPYVFDFLSIGEEAQEREIEKELTKHIQKFLLELGAGFAFVGNQYHLEVDGEDYYIDMLFYHLKLRCYIVIELKAKKFSPEHAGKLNFYLSAIDAKLKGENDNPTIGIILCKDKGGKVRGEYALKDINKPIGLAEYKIVESIPKKLKTSLPTIEELEKELSQNKREKR